jgi:hypothetical protein
MGAKGRAIFEHRMSLVLLPSAPQRTYQRDPVLQLTLLESNELAVLRIQIALGIELLEVADITGLEAVT